MNNPKKMPKIPRSTTVPLALLVYLAFMSYVGRGYFRSGEYLYYFGIIGATLVVIIALHFFLKKRERLRRERESDLRDRR